MVAWSMACLPLPQPPALQGLLESLPGAEEDAVEVQAVEAQVRAEALLVLVGDVVAQEKLPVAVGRERADELPHGLRLLVEQDRRELARRRVNRLRQLLIVRVGPPAGRLAPLGGHQVARRAAEEARQPGRLLEALLPQPLEHDAERLLMEV